MDTENKSVGKEYAQRGEAIARDGLKRCSSCTHFLSVEQFDKNRRSKDGLFNEDQNLLIRAVGYLAAHIE
jgi:hypothetical protein